ncbi:ShlB/FhaC/HecB family hemolysin secretion/activation protein [Marinobacterium sp. LSUCC0821]|nr:ShlB/FhaC/HecB family hemolysin secretion/activation protein [Marinobacterium sp. LSUCC0821]
MGNLRFILFFVAAAVAVLIPLSASAMNIPDASSIMRDLEQQKMRDLALPTFPKQPEKVVELPPLDPSKSVLIKEIVFEGNESLTTLALDLEFANQLNQNFDFTRMKNLADQVGFFYQKQGLWAKAILPQQTLENGQLIIRIFEGRLGKVEIEKSVAEGEELRFPDDRIRDFILNGQKVGSTFSILEFEDSVKNLNAVPGITASAVLRAGEELGETDVVINAANAPMVSGSLSLDGNGGRATGYNQATTSLSIDGPFGVGDQVTAMLMKSEALTVKSLGGSYPLFSDGTRIGLNITKVNVAISGSPESISGTYLLNLSKPFKQSTDMNVTGTASLTRKDTPDEVTADVLALNGVFSWPSTFLGFDSVNSVNLTSTTGFFYPKTNAEASTNGLYNKFGFNLKQALTLNDTDQLSLTLMGQVAFNNLDSGEKFGIAGLPAVRAYPGGEATGDHGYFFSAQYQRQFGPVFLGRTFFDHGFVVKNQNPWNDEAATGNYVQLSGVGIGGTWNLPGFMVNADVATRLGRNPVAQDDGNDSDGTHRNVRAWISVMIPF